jgi:hypothetical protein
VDDIRKYLAFGMTVGAFTLLGIILIFHGSDEIRVAMVTGAFGILGTIAGYYWGSTAGSQRKTELIGEILKKEDCK